MHIAHGIFAQIYNCIDTKWSEYGNFHRSKLRLTRMNQHQHQHQNCIQNVQNQYIGCLNKCITWRMSLPRWTIVEVKCSTKTMLLYKGQKKHFVSFRRMPEFWEIQYGYKQPTFISSLYSLCAIRLPWSFDSMRKVSMNISII